MEVAAQNIANADTPGYDVKRVEFEDQLLRAMNSGNILHNKATHDRHIKIAETDPSKVMPRVVSDTHYVKRMDDNNVDIDKEMVDMAKNTIQYNALIQKINKEFSRIKYAVRGT
jgi:flagellar basal-body rod protein FlgB